MKEADSALSKATCEGMVRAFIEGNHAYRKQNRNEVHDVDGKIAKLLGEASWSGKITCRDCDIAGGEGAHAAGT
jgi:hypothetical protein